MDLGSLIGVVLGFGVVVYGMLLGGPVSMYVDVPSVMITVLGSIFIAMMKFNLGQFLMAFKVAGKAFMYKGDKLEDLIAKAVELADAARKGGFLALEAAEIPSPFMKKGIDMLVDGHDADVVRSVLEKDIDLTAERHSSAIKVFRTLGDLGPAMGMIGTLVGLVAMLFGGQFLNYAHLPLLGMAAADRRAVSRNGILRFCELTKVNIFIVRV